MGFHSCFTFDAEVQQKRVMVLLMENDTTQALQHAEKVGGWLSTILCTTYLMYVYWAVKIGKKMTLDYSF